MSEWMDFAVYAAFNTAIWGWLPAGIARSAIAMIEDRNPHWMATHPELRQRLTRGGWFNRLCLLWGLLSVSLLLAFQTGAWPQRFAFSSATPKWEALKDLHSVLLVIGLIVLSGYGAVVLRWLHRNVPLAARRRASLERRSVHDHVPQVIQYAIYGAVILHLGLWVMAGVTGRYATPAFWGLLAFQFVVAAVFLSLAVGAVRRRPGAIDRVFGPGYRRTEVRVGFAAQLMPLMNGIARLYEQVARTPAENIDRVLHLGLVLLVLAMALLFGQWSRRAEGASGSSWLPSTKSAGVLVD